MERLGLAVKEIQTHMPDLELSLQEPMRNHCSFRIGGPAAAMAFPKSIAEVQALSELLRGLGIRPFVMGNGTNLLVNDGPFEHIVIKFGEKLSAIRAVGNDELEAECGVSLARLAVHAKDLSLSGLEFAHGIPGTLGGAVSMNAGAYGGEMKDVITETLYLDENCRLQTLQGGMHQFVYRHSAFSEQNWMILRSRVKLAEGDAGQIHARMQELMEKRRNSQPLDKPSAGSTFKRPSSGYAAALIDQAGLKGYAVGGAQVSEKHAGFVINRGDATFQDVVQIIEDIQEVVMKTYGIALEPEVRIFRN